MHKVSVLHEEAQLEQMDSLRPKAPTLEGWSEAEEQELLIKWAAMNRGSFSYSVSLIPPSPILSFYTQVKDSRIAHQKGRPSGDLCKFYSLINSTA